MISYNGITLKIKTKVSDSNSSTKALLASDVCVLFLMFSTETLSDKNMKTASWSVCPVHVLPVCLHRLYTDVSSGRLSSSLPGDL